MNLKVFSFIISITILYSCSSNEKMSCKISGKVCGNHGDKIFLWKVNDKKFRRYKKIDSTIVKNNKFNFDLGRINANLYCLSIDRTKRYLFLDNSNVNVKYNTDRVGRDLAVEASGCDLHDEFSKFCTQKDSIMDYRKERDSIMNAKNEAGDNEELRRKLDDEIKSLYYTRYDKQVQFISDYVEQNINSVIGLYLANEYYIYQHNYDYAESIDKFEKLLSNCNKEMKKSVYYSKIKEKLDRYRKCSIGSIAPPIYGTDSTGNKINLSDFRGKYVLVDFWSSYCSWCRYESPNIANAYKEYKDSGLEVLGVSSDWKKDAWLKAIEEDNAHWNQIIIDNNDRQKIFSDYCISGIPKILLISPEGKILDKGLRGDNIMKSIEKHIK